VFAPAGSIDNIFVRIHPKHAGYGSCARGSQMGNALNLTLRAILT
jgi:hypothetical protein